MKTLLVGLAMLLAASTAEAAKKQDAKKAASAPAVDPNAAVARAHGGKVYVVVEPSPNSEGEELSKWLSSRPATTEIAKKANEERWPMTFIAVFKKPPAKGPMTVEFMDKKDPSTLVDQYSPQTPGGSLVYQEPYDLETNNGFNKGHVYIIKVGQIIKSKFVSYASGEVSLK